MRSGITFGITPSDKARLEAIIAARGSPQKHVWRARIVLLSGDGVGTMAIMAATGKSKTCVWRWQERFMAEGVDGLLRDNAVEGFFAKLTRRQLKYGVFHSIVDLQAAINRFIKEHNEEPRPFAWKADPDKIIAAVRRGHQTLESIH